MMIHFITGNSEKFKDARRHFDSCGINLKQTIMFVPEIQAEHANEVCKRKAEYVSGRINLPFFVEDSSFHIPALKEFPGVYVKYVLETLGTEGLLKVMSGIKNRECYFRSCICYYNEKKEKHEFTFIRDNLYLTEKPYSSIHGWSQLWNIIGLSDYGKHFSELNPLQASALEDKWRKETPFTQLTDFIREVNQDDV
ncbi:hypothetical protein GC090_20270 (plasmid) [Pantoea sp. JZ29]|uniref:non-canonical purine NTP pyrophosphatase n=1 Tax=Pantoea sp. JZ29 TaxID=2654192 RepID=UPI002B4A7BD6|nr:non-canonical purine NTP pyrophosphatase [Pantoea sp. JZ29]WRH23003.1 hypothetical protein GC090_20270 [Pantoea sp. JZ29]